MKIIKNIISISIVVGIFFFVSACQYGDEIDTVNNKTDEGSAIAGMDSKVYIFDYVRQNEMELNQIAKLISEYDFPITFYSDDSGNVMIRVNRNDESRKNEVESNKTLIELVNNQLNKNQIISIGTIKFKHRDDMAILVALNSVSDPQGLLMRSLEYSEEDLTQNGDEKVTEYWYYFEAYGT
ncbi:hypothetical protein AGMMS49983_20580 [Clostridia bacterium]|nr:hypothetical protein AGMMS49983_20580 [Clostridia bacterium]